MKTWKDTAAIAALQGILASGRSYGDVTAAGRAREVAEALALECCKAWGHEYESCAWVSEAGDDLSGTFCSRCDHEKKEGRRDR